MRQIHSYLCPLRAGILLFLLLLVSIAAPAQTEVSCRRGATQLEDILPPSPEAASRVKYSDVPFTHSTGAAEYSVPIYELKGRRLSIPVSLDYCKRYPDGRDCGLNRDQGYPDGSEVFRLI